LTYSLFSGDWEKVYKDKDWHMVVLTSRKWSDVQETTWYFSEYAPVASQVGRVVQEISQAMGADCSRTMQYVRNVNQIFNPDSWPEFKKGGVTGLKVTDNQVRTVHNFRYGIAAGDTARFSMRQITSDRFDTGFLNDLPTSYTDGLLHHQFPEFVGKEGEGMDRRAMYMSFGFESPFDAYATHHNGVLNAVDWVCSMLMPDPLDCLEVFWHPLAFLDQVRSLMPKERGQWSCEGWMCYIIDVPMSQEDTGSMYDGGYDDLYDWLSQPGFEQAAASWISKYSK